MAPSLSRNTTDTATTSTGWHSAVGYPQSEPQEGGLHPGYSTSSVDTSRSSSLTLTPPHEPTQDQNNDDEPSVSPQQLSSYDPTAPAAALFTSRPRRHSAYLASHPHPYHPLPSPRSSISTTPSRTSVPSPSTAVPEGVEVAGEFEVARGGEALENVGREGVGMKEETAIEVNPVGWDGPDDPENPQNWSVKYKWFVTAICILMTVNVTFASSAPTVAAQGVMEEFGISQEVSSLITTMFLLGYVFGPFFWGPGSELIGRKPVFVLTLTLFTLFHLGQSLAQNIQTLLVTRFLSGFFAVAPLTNCGGLIVDIWPAVGRGPATSLFSASVFLGPVLGPIVSGFIIQQGISWRWVFWVMMFFGAGCTLITIPFLPETYAPVILLKKAQRLRKEDSIGNKHLYAEHEKQDWSITGVLNRTLLRPFKMLAMEPILVLINIYISIVYGLLYALFQAFPIIFTVRYHFTIAQTSLIFIGVGIGTTIGSLINFYCSLHYPQLIAKWRGFPPAEERLIGAMIGAPTLVVGIFWLGWTGEYESVPWYVAGLSTIAIGTGISLIFISFLSYLVDTYLMYSASAFAATTFCRSAVAAAFPLFTVQMFTALGVNWACTLIGLIALLLLPSPFLFYKYGARIRERSRFAPCIDLKIKRQIEEEERQKEKVASQETV